jgi:hypothetical protein
VLQVVNILSNAKPTEADHHLPILLESINEIVGTCSNELRDLVHFIKNLLVAIDPSFQTSRQREEERIKLLSFLQVSLG